MNEFWGFSDGFMTAAGISSYDGGRSTTTTDPTIGQLKIIIKSWSPKVGLEFKDIDSHPCTEEDLNFGN